jgi:general secretion pathway protein L
MALEAGKFSLFGLDLARAWTVFSAGWSEALSWQPLAWLSPHRPVRLLMPDGTEEWRKGATSEAASAGSDTASVAVLLPDDIVLYRELVLPDLLLEDLARAAALEVELNSPFSPSDLVWGMRSAMTADGGRHVRIALASRKHVAAHLESRQIDGTRVEVWAGESDPVVFDGYAEPGREQASRRRRTGILAALGMLIVLLLVLAATPWYIQRARIFDAQAHHVALEASVAPVVSNREALLRSSAQLAAIGQHLHTEADALAVLARLTAVLPDSAHLTRLEVNGAQVRFAGIASNAAQLVETLGGQDVFSNVRTPTAISRTADGRESFTVELTLHTGIAQP